jgi:CheY-like chemotaxis protein
MRHLLIVDDSPTHRGILKQCLRSVGCELWEATNGREALNAIESLHPDCVILDLMMPEMGGFDVLRALRRDGIVLPIVVATTDMHEETRRACVDLGAMEVIYKPLDPREVLAAVERAFALSETRAAAREASETTTEDRR